MGTKMDLKRAKQAAAQAARAVGVLMRRNLKVAKRANLTTQHDIKLELDVRSQKLIERALRTAFPQVSLLGEEGDAGRADAAFRWVVDPIDGTVNFAYGIPHACVSIALQQRTDWRAGKPDKEGYETIVRGGEQPVMDRHPAGHPGRADGVDRKNNA